MLDNMSVLYFNKKHQAKMCTNNDHELILRRTKNYTIESFEWIYLQNGKVHNQQIQNGKLLTYILMCTEDLLVIKILITGHKSNTTILYKPTLNRYDVKLQLIN